MTRTGVGGDRSPRRGRQRQPRPGGVEQIVLDDHDRARLADVASATSDGPARPEAHAAVVEGERARSSYCPPPNRSVTRSVDLFDGVDDSVHVTDEPG